MKQACACLLVLLLAGCAHALSEPVTSKITPHRSLIGRVVSAESITVVATNGSLHQADIIRFTTDGRLTEEFVSIFACPVKDGHNYAVSLEATAYHFIGDRAPDAMPSYMVSFCGPIDENKSFGRL